MKAKTQQAKRAVRHTVGGMMDMLGATLKRKKFSERISLKDPILKKIYSEIIEYNPLVDKVKPEKVKVQR